VVFFGFFAKRLTTSKNKQKQTGKSHNTPEITSISHAARTLRYLNSIFFSQDLEKRIKSYVMVKNFKQLKIT